MTHRSDLSTEAILQSLRAQRLGCRIESHAEIDSTNLEAARRARDGAPEGTVVLADAQTQGRGRLGRTWVSPPGCNLYCSVILRPDLPPADVPLLTLVAGMATAETVAEWVAEGVAIKWPNDVVIDGRKVAGILSEMECDGRGVQFAVTGIGVNLNAAADDFPPEVRKLATSIAEASGRAVDREAFCARLLSRFDDAYDLLLRQGFAAVVPLWERRDGLRGRRVQVRDGSERIEGLASGLGPRGELRLETASGLRQIVAGDVNVIEGYRLRG